MSRVEVALFFHVLGAIVFAGGAIVAGVAFEAARRREEPHDVALLLGLTRIGVALVGLGGLLVLGFGLWLVDLVGVGLGASWIVAALCLFVASGLLGALGGRRPKQARRLAERLDREDGSSTPELRRLLDDPFSRLANYASAALVVAILALMIWKP
jgi:uncharacterized membrane protein